MMYPSHPYEAGNGKVSDVSDVSGFRADNRLGGKSLWHHELGMAPSKAQDGEVVQIPKPICCS